MVEEVRAGIAAALADPEARVLVLASAVDGYFSAGADLKAFATMRGPQMRAWAELCHDIVHLLRNAPKPLLAAINGTAVGGGLEMALHCDIRFAAADARLGQPEINIAFLPPIATTQALARLIGRPRAIRYLYDGTLVDAARAQEWGLVTSWWRRPTASACAGLCQRLAAKPASALAAIRRTITWAAAGFEEGMAWARSRRAAGRHAGLRRWRRRLPQQARAEMDGRMIRPLDGTTILEIDGPHTPLCLRLATSLAAKIAADLGASVLKLEPQDGDLVRTTPPLLPADGRSALFHVLYTSKRSIRLPADQRAALETLLAGRIDAALYEEGDADAAALLAEREAARVEIAGWPEACRARTRRSAASPCWRWAACSTWWARPTASHCAWAVIRDPTRPALPRSPH